MSALIWAGFGFLAGVFVGGTAFVAVRALAAWRVSRTALGSGLTALERLLKRAEATTTRVAELATAGERALDAATRLRTSTARLRILVGALQDATSLVGTVRGVVPRK